MQELKLIAKPVWR